MVRTSIDNSQVNAVSISHGPELVFAERIGIWVRASRCSVEDKVADRDDIVVVGGGNSTSAKTSAIVGQITDVGLGSQWEILMITRIRL